jgi:hypothetical protein
MRYGPKRPKDMQVLKWRQILQAAPGTSPDTILLYRAAARTSNYDTFGRLRRVNQPSRFHHVKAHVEAILTGRRLFLTGWLVCTLFLLADGCSNEESRRARRSVIKHESHAMADWNSFLETWQALAELYEPVTLISEAKFEPTEAFGRRFPKLAALLSASRVTVLQTDKGPRHVHGWTAPDGTVFGWVCYPPALGPPDGLPLHPDHRLLLSSFGGIDEYWSPPRSLINNLNGALGLQDSGVGIGREESFFHICSSRGIRADFNPRDHLVFATEANGDSFFYNQQAGSAFLLGFDTGRSNLARVKGYEELLHTVRGAPDFQSWVEMLAEEHLAKLHGR